MTLFKIAFRNILRNKRRTATSSIIIAIGLLFFIFMDSVMTGMDKSAINNMIQLNTSSIKIYTSTFYKEKKSFPFKYEITNQSKIEEFLYKYPFITGITPRFEFLGEISNYQESRPIVGKVILAKKDSSVFKLIPYIKGSYFSKNSNNEVILGKKLAEEMKVGIGDNVTLFALTKFDSRNADDFTVVGILHTSDPNINRNTVLITYQAANEFLDLENMITELNISIKKQSSFENEIKTMRIIQSDLTNKYKSLKVLTFMELGADFINLKNQKKAWSWVFIIVILLIAAVGIFNTVLMSVYERIREIGVLRAHGFKPKELTFLFVLEGSITGILGSTLGVILGCFTNIYLIYYGYPIDKLVKDMDASGFPVWGTIYGQWNIDIIILAFVFGVVIATIAAIIPARKAGKMKITEALKFI